MSTHLVVGIDVGTTKICTIVGEVRAEDIFVVGVGIEPSRGMKKGVVTDITSLSAAIASSVHKAEKNSGFDIKSAFVSISGKDVASFSSRGSVGLTSSRGVREDDLERAIENARTIAIPHNKEVLHIIPRAYALDGQEHVRSPIGMHGFRLDVEVAIITASATSIANLDQTLKAALIIPDRYILNPLASGEAVLTAEEREMGVVIIDIGGGTTDLAIFIEGGVWHSAVIPIGGDLITNDMTHWMKVPFEVAEAVKLQYGHAREKAVSQTETFQVETFGEEGMVRFQRSDIAMVIEARVTELFERVQREIKMSGYDGLLRAGAVITGGCAQLPGLREVAQEVLGMPVRLAKPERMTGMADILRSPAYSTSVGLLRMGLGMDPLDRPLTNGNGKAAGSLGKWFGGLFKGLLPDEE